MKRLGRIFLYACLWIGLAAFPGEAHKVLVFAYFEGTSLVGEVYFSTGNPARGVPVTVTSGESLLAQGFTDEKGFFSVPLKTLPSGEVKVTADAGMGHQATQILKPEPGEKDPGPSSEVAEKEDLKTKEKKAPGEFGVSSEVLRKILREELKPFKTLLLSLRKEQEKPGVTQIVGGIGYIFGLVGITMWFWRGRKSG